jgi:hypothetical protein
MKKIWEYYSCLHFRFLSSKFSETFHYETLKHIYNFKTAFFGLFGKTKIVKIHALDELWFDSYYNGPSYLFETSPMESKHKQYRKY